MANTVIMSRDTLLEGGRINRLPLRQWARHLISTLRELDVTDHQSWGMIAGAMNNAALIEVYRGDKARAHDLCHLQLSWIENMSRLYGVYPMAPLIPQPWINIGRLQRIEKAHRESLAHFDLLALDWHEGKTCVGPFELEAGAWMAALDEHDVHGELEAVYVVESFKSYLGARDLPGALDFLERASAKTGEGGQLLLTEALITTYMHLAEYKKAMSLINAPVWNGEPHHKLVRATYQAAIFLAAGFAAQAEKLVRQLAERVLSADLSGQTDHKILRYLAYLGELAEGLQLRDIAHALWTTALAGSERIIDVPMQLVFIERLLAFDDDLCPRRAELEAMRSLQLHTAGFVSISRGRGVTVSDDVKNAPVFAELRAELRAVAASPITRAESFPKLPEPLAPATSGLVQA